MSNYCSDCGNELTEDVKFCSECGTQIAGDDENNSEWEPPEDTGEWPYGESESRMKQGRETFGYCPACGIDAMWAKEGITRGTGKAECKVCDAKWVSRSHGFGSFGQYEYECVVGPDDLVGEVKVEDGWKHTGTKPGPVEEAESDEPDDSGDERKPSKIIGNCPVCGEPPGKGAYSDSEITCPTCESHWERKGTTSTTWELVESEQAPEWVGETQSQTIWKELEPGDDIDEIIESKRENFDKTLGRLPGLSSENTTRRNVLVGSGYALVGLITVGVLAGGDDEPDVIEDEWFGEVATEHNPETFDPDEDMAIVIEWVEDSVEVLEEALYDTSMDDTEGWANISERADSLLSRFIDDIDPLFGEPGEVQDGIPAYDMELAEILDGPDENLDFSVAQARNIGSTIADGEEPTELEVNRFVEETEIVLSRIEEHDDL